MSGDRSVQFTKSAEGNWIRQASLSPFKRGKATETLGQREPLYPREVCVYQRGVMLYPHPGALGNLSSSGQGASGHFSTFTCLSKHLLQLWQVSTPQTWTGLMPSQTRSHHSVFAGRCSYNILKTAPAFQPGVSEGKTSACETASSGIPGPAVRAGI